MKNKLTDCHVHLEQGDYTSEWLQKFVDTAVERNIGELYLLEHCYRFSEFLPIYTQIRAENEMMNVWLKRKAGVLELSEYLKFIEQVRKKVYPIKIKFGLEICYFEDSVNYIEKITRDKELDFLVGSVHFVDNLPYDHKLEYWNGFDVNWVYSKYFELSNSLVKCGIFDGIAHPDCIKIFGHKPDFSLLDLYDELAANIAESGMYAEQNGGAHRRYPEIVEAGMHTELIKAMKRHGVRILTASDAHKPEDVGLYVQELYEKLG